MTEDILTKEDYQKILQEYFQTKSSTENFCFGSAEWSSTSKDVQGFMGEHYDLKLYYHSGCLVNDIKFFVKTKPRKNEFQKEAVESLRVIYKKEIFLYKNLFEEYEKLGYYMRFAPKAYFTKGEDTIVMENLKEKSFHIMERTIFYDLDHCKGLLKSLAYFHGNFLAYEETKSKELGKPFRINMEFPEVFEEVLYKEGDSESLGAKYISSSILCMKALANLVPEDQSWKDDFISKLEGFDYVKIMNEALPYRKTCGHGDLWCNNMLFQDPLTSGSKMESPINCRLIDFQVLRYYYPAFDVLLGLHTNTRKDFRDNHLSELLEYYYRTLEEILKGYGYDISKIIPKEHYDKTCEFFRGVSILQSICGRTMTFIPTEITNDAVNSGSDELGEIIDDGRVRYVLEAYKRSQLFRELMNEDLHDLYDVM